MKIAITGTVYVGQFMAQLVQWHEAVALDMVPAKVSMINQRQSPIRPLHVIPLCNPRLWVATT